MIVSRLLVLCPVLLVLVSGYERQFDGNIYNSPIWYDNITVNSSTLITVKFECTLKLGTGYLNIRLRNSSDSQTILTLSGPCDGELYSNTVFETAESDGFLRLDITGNSGTWFNVTYFNNVVNLIIGEPQPETIKDGGISLHTFTFPCDDKEWIHSRYADVTVAADSTFIDTPHKKDVTPVGKLIVTQNLPELYLFLDRPNVSTPNSMRLSFSTFGRIVLSDVSKPKLTNDKKWYLAVVLFNKTDYKRFTLTVSATVDKLANHYLDIIGLVVVSSVTGVIILALSSYVSKEVNLKPSWSLYQWLCVVANWVWRGEKGLAYLSGFMGYMLIVSAIQIVYAKWDKMRETGDRDICYYNEKCYRPFTSHYDVSINRLASNICFMTHGLIIILRVSYLEARCATANHKNYNYSIAYSFGLVYIFEGIGSLLYHICPNQIIFQFDTLFMFAISVCTVAAVVDGYTARTNDDVAFYPVVHKSIRVPKMFLFFLGPAYLFNFLGNLRDTEGLPGGITIPFLIFLGLWVVLLLLWAAYKLEFLPNARFKRPNIREIICQEGGDCSRRLAFSKMIFYTLCEKCGDSSWCLAFCKMFFYAVYLVVIIILFIVAAQPNGSSANFILYGMVLLAGLTVVGCCLYFFLIDVPSHKRKISSSKCGTCYPTIALVFYVLLGLGFGVVAIYFFKGRGVTDKSEEPWKSREHNSDCMLFDFWDAHDLWHFFVSHFLMVVALSVIQMSRPCRDCFTEHFVDKQLVVIGIGGDRNIVLPRDGLIEGPISRPEHVTVQMSVPEPPTLNTSSSSSSVPPTPPKDLILENHDEMYVRHKLLKSTVSYELLK